MVRVKANPTLLLMFILKSGLMLEKPSVHICWSEPKLKIGGM